MNLKNKLLVMASLTCRSVFRSHLPLDCGKVGVAGQCNGSVAPWLGSDAFHGIIAVSAFLCLRKFSSVTIVGGNV